VGARISGGQLPEIITNANSRSMHSDGYESALYLFEKNGIPFVKGFLPTVLASMEVSSLV
jgi:hypothetical protein